MMHGGGIARSDLLPKGKRSLIAELPVLGRTNCQKPTQHPAGLERRDLWQHGEQAGWPHQPTLLSYQRSTN